MVQKIVIDARSGSRFMTNSGRLGVLMRPGRKRNSYGKWINGWHIRAVGQNKLKNLYSYFVSDDYLLNRVIKWYKPDEIKIPYKKIEHYDATGKPCLASDGVCSKRVVKYI